MDTVAIREKGKKLWSKYKYVLLVLLIGIALMNLPEKEKAQAPQEAASSEEGKLTTAQELEQILSMIDGAGEVRVMLTEASGTETVYQTDENTASSGDSTNTKVETVIITDSSRSQSGLVKTVIAPTYLGAIVICSGGNDPSVRLAIVEAVSNVTGISSDHVTVLKMK